MNILFKNFNLILHKLRNKNTFATKIHAFGCKSETDMEKGRKMTYLQSDEIWRDF